MGHRILVADDSITIQKVIGLTFANEDFELDTADNGDEAFEKVKAAPPHLIIADTNMPGLSGYELCARVRSTPALAHIPLILLTGTYEAFDEDRAKQVGASDHLTKPFESQVLIDKVRALLSRPSAQASITDTANVEDLESLDAIDAVEEITDLDDVDFGGVEPDAQTPDDFGDVAADVTAVAAVAPTTPPSGDPWNVDDFSSYTQSDATPASVESAAPAVDQMMSFGDGALEPQTPLRDAADGRGAVAESPQPPAPGVASEDADIYAEFEAFAAADAESAPATPPAAGSEGPERDVFAEFAEFESRARGDSLAPRSTAGMSGGIGHGDDIRTEELETSEGSAFAESLELPVEDSPEPTTSFAAEIQYSDSLAEMANEPQFQSADQAPAAVAPSAAAPAAPVSSSPSAVTTGALLADLESRLAPQIEAKVNAILAEALPRIVEDTVVRAIERALADLRKRLG